MSVGNERSRRLLPPMGALNTFAAAARLGSFSKAGDEVGLTQSAVSRQVALLEDWLQTPLFHRVGRRVALNAHGRAYADEVAPALDRIRRATARISGKRPTNELNIATLPSFGMRWLAPRLPRLTALHPELVVNFAARSVLVDFGNEPFDAAIEFGRPPWPRVHHDLLFREAAIPVCSPDWLAANPICEPRDLYDKVLLFQATRRGAWDRWFACARVDAEPVQPGPTFEHFLMLAQAAVAGTGAALIPSFLIEPELAAGTLVCAVDVPLSTEDAYYIVYPEGGAERGSLAKFRNWIIDEAAQQIAAP